MLMVLYNIYIGGGPYKKIIGGQFPPAPPPLPSPMISNGRTAHLLPITFPSHLLLHHWKVVPDEITISTYKII